MASPTHNQSDQNQNPVAPIGDTGISQDVTTLSAPPAGDTGSLDVEISSDGESTSSPLFLDPIIEPLSEADIRDIRAMRIARAQGMGSISAQCDLAMQISMLLASDEKWLLDLGGYRNMSEFYHMVTIQRLKFDLLDRGDSGDDFGVHLSRYSLARVPKNQGKALDSYQSRLKELFDLIISEDGSIRDFVGWTRVGRVLFQKFLEIYTQIWVEYASYFDSQGFSINCQEYLVEQSVWNHIVTEEKAHLFPGFIPDKVAPTPYIATAQFYGMRRADAYQVFERYLRIRGNRFQEDIEEEGSETITPLAE